MTSTKTLLSTFLATLALLLSVSGPAAAKTKDSRFEGVKISNFGQMDDRFYRGARPKDKDYKALAALGVRTIIDLTDNSRSYEEPAVKAAGLRYVNIPIEDKTAPTMDQVNAFLRLVNDPSTGKFYVHCAGGRHRTGIMGAVYRFNHDHWNLDQVLAEMDRYEFGSGMGHGKQKDFVKTYFQQFQAQQTTMKAVATAGR